MFLISTDINYLQAYDSVKVITLYNTNPLKQNFSNLEVEFSNPLHTIINNKQFQK